MAGLTRDDLLRATTDPSFAAELVEVYGYEALMLPDCENCGEEPPARSGPVPRLFVHDPCGCGHDERLPFELLPPKVQTIIREKAVAWP